MVHQPHVSTAKLGAQAASGGDILKAGAGIARRVGMNQKDLPGAGRGRAIDDPAERQGDAADIAFDDHHPGDIDA
ncbi:MAG: hypothetical protein R3E04_01975 [Sphingobium sp.]